MLRVAYYTSPWYLDVALPFVREMSRSAELHLFLQLAPEAWCTSLFDVRPMDLPSGILEADPILRPCFPPGVRACWQGAASFNLVVHTAGAIHPATWRVGHRAMQLIRRLGPDVLHLEDPTLRLPLVGLGRVPLVLSLHDPEPHSGEKHWRDDLASWLVFPRVSRFVLHSRSLKEPFCRAYHVPAERVDVIPLGPCDLLREWDPGPVTPDERTVLFFGRLSPYKGVEVLYEAARRVAEQVPGVRFVIAGRPVPGYQPPSPPELANGAQCVAAEGYIPNPQLAHLLRQATVVVCPYNDATQSAVVLTAYAFGKPVVATAVGGLPEYVIHGETGLLVPPRDPRSLADALISILTDPAMRERMQAGIARARGGQLSWASITEQTLRTYARVVRGPRMGHLGPVAAPAAEGRAAEDSASAPASAPVAGPGLAGREAR